MVPSYHIKWQIEMIKGGDQAIKTCAETLFLRMSQSSVEYNGRDLLSVCSCGLYQFCQHEEIVSKIVNLRYDTGRLPS